MTEQGQKAWEELVGKCQPNNTLIQNRFHPVVLAADAELTRLREIVDEAILVIEMRRSNFSDGLPLAKLWELTRAELRRRAKEG